ncbi:hypothetical protein ACOMHN_027334 [Nucella lapillus]
MNINDRMEGGTRGPVLKQDISLGSTVNISSALAGLVQDLLGPGGQQTLLSTSTGKVMVTRDGLTILSSLHLAHPVAHFVMQSLRSHSSLHRDGSKTFVIYLSQILKDIAHRINGKTRQSAVSRVKLSLELNKFLCSDFQHVAKLVVDKVKVCSLEKCEEDCVSVVKKILQGSLQTCLQKQMVPFFTDFLTAFLSFENPGKGDLEYQLEHILQHFDMYHSKITTQPLQKSRVCEGIFLEADLQTIFLGKIEDGAVLSKRFALMDVNFDYSQNERGENVVSVHLTSRKLETFFSQKRKSLESAVKSLKSAGVNVLLCSDTIPQFMQGLCRENGISVQCLPHDRLVFLSDLTGTPVLRDLSEVAPTECFFEGKFGEQRQFTEKWTYILSMAGKGQLLGLGGYGAVTNVDCFEPVATKLAVVASVLQLVVQLLRLEAVVPVKNLLSCPPPAKELSDDENELDEV